MDKALVFGTKDCRFESCQGQHVTNVGGSLGVDCLPTCALASLRSLCQSILEQSQPQLLQICVGVPICFWMFLDLAFAHFHFLKYVQKVV